MMKKLLLILLALSFLVSCAKTNVGDYNPAKKPWRIKIFSKDKKDK